MHEYDMDTDGIDNVNTGDIEQPKYTHSARPSYEDGSGITNHEGARTHAEIAAEATGVSCRDEGLSMKRPMRGVGHNDQFPWRGPNHGHHY